MKWLAYVYLRLTGWRFEGTIPPVPKMIVVGAPHTSNWDFVLFLGALHHFDIKVSYIAKASLFRWPFGAFFKWLGGIPVDRSASRGLVASVEAAFDAVDEMILVIAPEGTRKAAPHWKSGFVHIAEACDVPVVVAGVNYSEKWVRIGPPLHVGADTGELMDRIREFYESTVGRYPELRGPVRLRSESAQA